MPDILETTGKWFCFWRLYGADIATAVMLFLEYPPI